MRFHSQIGVGSNSKSVTESPSQDSIFLLLSEIQISLEVWVMDLECSMKSTLEPSGPHTVAIIIITTPNSLLLLMLLFYCCCSFYFLLLLFDLTKDTFAESAKINTFQCHEV